MDLYVSISLIYLWISLSFFTIMFPSNFNCFFLFLSFPFLFFFRYLFFFYSLFLSFSIEFIIPFRIFSFVFLSFSRSFILNFIYYSFQNFFFVILSWLFSIDSFFFHIFHPLFLNERQNIENILFYILSFIHLYFFYSFILFNLLVFYSLITSFPSSFVLHPFYFIFLFCIRSFCFPYFILIFFYFLVNFLFPSLSIVFCFFFIISLNVLKYVLIFQYFSLTFIRNFSMDFFYWFLNFFTKILLPLLN